MDRAIQKKLSSPWSKKLVKQTNKGWGDMDYVEHTQVTQRLIALIPDLSITAGNVIYDEIEDTNGVRRSFVTGVQVRLQGTIDGHYKTVEEYGDCDKDFFHENPNKVKNNGHRIKECMSDGIKRSGMRLGIGLELCDDSVWINDFLNAETEEE